MSTTIEDVLKYPWKSLDCPSAPSCNYARCSKKTSPNDPDPVHLPCNWFRTYEEKEFQKGIRKQKLQKLNETRSR